MAAASGHLAQDLVAPLLGLREVRQAILDVRMVFLDSDSKGLHLFGQLLASPPFVLQPRTQLRHRSFRAEEGTLRSHRRGGRLCRRRRRRRGRGHRDADWGVLSLLSARSRRCCRRIGCGAGSGHTRNCSCWTTRTCRTPRTCSRSRTRFCRATRCNGGAGCRVASAANRRASWQDMSTIGSRRNTCSRNSRFTSIRSGSTSWQDMGTIGNRRNVCSRNSGFSSIRSGSTCNSIVRSSNGSGSTGSESGGRFNRDVTASRSGVLLQKRLPRHGHLRHCQACDLRGLGRPGRGRDGLLGAGVDVVEPLQQT
mmetsp:Transcript_65157/g.187284  ORF Transcript_65157/g.187284 Transcript_65157/m.187284 type:complete len:310 (+) Transcript_65157:2543-3472(+)